MGSLSEEFTNHPKFDESGKRGAKQAVQRLIIWYDLKHYRRFVKVIIGTSNPVAVHTGFQVIVGNGVSVLGDGHPIPKKFYEEQLTQAKQGKWYAELKNAGRDPNTEKYENELILEFGKRALYDIFQKPIFNVVKVPLSVKSRFTDGK